MQEEMENKKRSERGHRPKWRTRSAVDFQVPVTRAKYSVSLRLKSWWLHPAQLVARPLHLFIVSTLLALRAQSRVWWHPQIHRA